MTYCCLRVEYEKVDATGFRPYSTIMFRIANAVDTLVQILGKLKQVSLIMNAKDGHNLPCKSVVLEAQLRAGEGPAKLTQIKRNELPNNGSNWDDHSFTKIESYLQLHMALSYQTVLLICL